MLTLIVGLSPGSAFARRGKQWTLDHEVAALSTEALAHLWADDLPDQLLSHPDRPKPPDKRLRTSDPTQILRFLGR